VKRGGVYAPSASITTQRFTPLQLASVFCAIQEAAARSKIEIEVPIAESCAAAQTDISRVSRHDLCGRKKKDRRGAVLPSHNNQPAITGEILFPIFHLGCGAMSQTHDQLLMRIGTPTMAEPAALTTAAILWELTVS
jgi:hypothetical protein